MISYLTSHVLVSFLGPLCGIYWHLAVELQKNHLSAFPTVAAKKDPV